MSDASPAPRDDALALRPALDDLIERQEAVLARLARGPIPHDKIPEWTLGVSHACVGRLGEGIVRLLLHPDYSLVVRQLLVDPGVTGRIYRGRLHRALVAVFARSLETQAGMSIENLPGLGVATARATDKFQKTRYR